MGIKCYDEILNVYFQIHLKIYYAQWIYTGYANGIILSIDIEKNTVKIH